MDSEPEEEAGRSKVTRRQVLQTGAKLALLWTFPIIRSGTAFARGSQNDCDGEHATHQRAFGQACGTLAAVRRLEKDADRRAKKLCKKGYTCQLGDCGFESRSLHNTRCKQVPDATCKSGMGWQCAGTITSITCNCASACDPGQTCAACNAAQACQGNSNCNCWLLADASGCSCLFFVQFCGQFADCPNGQSDCDANAPGTTCVQTCCGNTCTPACGPSQVKANTKHSGRRTTRAR